MNIEYFIKKEHILFLNSNEKQVALKEMVTRLKELKELNDSNRYYAQIMHRESIENTGIGNGFAIPHARTDTMSSHLSVFGISRDGIDYSDDTNGPVYYILLSLFPTSESTKYLYLTGIMANIFADDAKRNEMHLAQTTAKVFSLLKKNTKLYFNTISENIQNNTEKINTLNGFHSCNLDLLIRLDRLYKLLESNKTNLKIERKIEELKKLIDKRTLSHYLKMVKRKIDPFAILEKKSCTGCHMDQAPVYITELFESDDIPTCSYCGRFLISF